MTAPTTTDDAKAKELEGRIAALENAKKFEATQEAVKEERMTMLAQLRTIREEITKSGGGGGGASSKELDALREENARLKAENEKHKYRIEHLCGSVKGLQEQVKAAGAAGGGSAAKTEGEQVVLTTTSTTSTTAATTTTRSTEDTGIHPMDSIKNGLAAVADKIDDAEGCKHPMNSIKSGFAAVAEQFDDDGFMKCMLDK